MGCRSKDKESYTIDIIGACMDKAASVSGCGGAPDALRGAGLIGVLKRSGCEIRDRGNVDEETETDYSPAPYSGRLNNLKEVNAVNSALYNKVSESLNFGAFPFVLGGDHSIAAATVSANITKHQKIGIIWVDAHGDFNNAFSSPSGNIHGTPLSALCGGGPMEILPFKPENTGFINPKNAVLIGARDLDDEEKSLLKKAGVTMFSVEDVRQKGMEKVAAEAVKIAADGTNGVYFSFDLDAIDPDYASGMGTPVNGGISLDEALLLCKIAAESGFLTGAEMVEYNPLLDTDAQTAKKVVSLIDAVIKNLKLHN